MASSGSFISACKHMVSGAQDALRGAAQWVRAGGRKRQVGVGAAAVGIATAITLTTMSAQAESGITITAEGYPAGTEAVADPATLEGYKTYPTGDQTTSYDSTQYAGRLWTDKTVIVPTAANNPNLLGTTATIPLADPYRNLDPSGIRTTPGQFEVDRTDSGIFLTCVSALSSSLTTELVEPVPLDIVLVLDVSGSMGENGTMAYVPYTAEELAALTPGQSFPNNTLFFKDRTGNYVTKLGFEGYCWVSENADGTGAWLVPYINKYANGRNVLYILTDDEDLEASQPRTLYANFVAEGANADSHVHRTDEYLPYTFSYTNFYTRQTHYKIDDLHEAASEFIGAIAENNTELAAQGYDTSKMSQIGIVKFSGQYTNNTYDRPVYQINNVNGRTSIMAPLKVYTNDGSEGTTEVTGIRQQVENLVANGGTAADNALVLADGILEGRGYYTNASNPEPGARSGVQQVVVFFTDGNPKHDRGNAPHDFSGLIAEQTLAQAKSLKDKGVTIYSVAVVDGGDPDDVDTCNLNIYLNGVSSNYLNASATGGVDNAGNNIYGTNVGNNVPANLEPQYYQPSSLSWSPDLGSRNDVYVPTSDTTVSAGKTYYTRSGKGTNADPYVYTEVVGATDEHLPTYFEKINYYLTVDGDQSLSDAFMKILNQITSGGAEETTAAGPDGNTALTITDYLGDYMEFKGLDGILYGVTADTTQFYAQNGVQRAYHTHAFVQRDDQTEGSVYTMQMQVPSALLNPEEGKENVNLSEIGIVVSRSTDPKVGDTVTISIPPDLIPSLRYEVTQQNNGDSVSTVATRQDADPLRIFYTVGPKAGTLAGVLSQLEEQSLRAENATNESDRQTEAFKSFMTNAAAYGVDGFYRLYSNLPTYDGTQVTQPTNGETTVNMVLSETNPYYFYDANEQLYVETSAGSGTYRKAGSADAGSTLYRCVRSWNVTTSAETESYYAWTGTPVEGTDGLLYIPAGTAKDADTDNTNVQFPKTDNTTETATTSLVSVFDASEVDPASGNHEAHQYLGNNGRLDIPVYGTLAATKHFTAGEGFELPTDPAPEATFTLTLKDKDGHALTEDDTYRALIRDTEGHPVDSTTHAISQTGADAVKFYVKDGSTFTLRDGETIKITNLPDGATYQLTETAMPGYAATVTNNDGTTETFGRGESSKTKDAPGA